jgi:hypothetical protein
MRGLTLNKFTWYVILFSCLINYLSANKFLGLKYLEDIDTKRSFGLKLFQQYLTQNFLEKTEVSYLNITDYSINSALYLIPNIVNLEIKLDNKTQSPLPLTIDSKGLQLIVPELANYPNNYNMSLRIFFDENNHTRPYISSQIDGSILYINFGMDFGINDSDDPNKDTHSILIIDIKAYIRIEYFNKIGDLPVHLNTFKLQSINVRPESSLDVDKNRLLSSLNAFLKIAVNLIDTMIEELDFFNEIKKVTGLEFHTFDIISNNGYLQLYLR